jgi:hypothetical protein
VEGGGVSGNSLRNTAVGSELPCMIQDAQSW